MQPIRYSTFAVKYKTADARDVSLITERLNRALEKGNTECHIDQRFTPHVQKLVSSAFRAAGWERVVFEDDDVTWKSGWDSCSTRVRTKIEAVGDDSRIIKK